MAPVLIFEKYSFMSIFTSLERINKPRMFGKAMAKIIISEKSITAPKLTEEPIIMKIKKSIYKLSQIF